MSGSSTQETMSAYVPLAEITVTGLNPRKGFDKEGLEQLANSIKTHGIVEPLIVRKGEKKKYELVAGERRLKAAKMVGLKDVPVVIREFSDDEVREVMLMENLQREDLRPVEEAEALKALVDLGTTREELANRIGMSTAWVAGRIRLLKLPEEILKYLEEGKLGVEQAMAHVPYCEWPVIDAMVKDLNAHFNPVYGRPRDDISLTDVKHMIDLQLCNGSKAQNLDFFGYMDSGQRIKKAFDFTECKKCKVPIKYGNIKRLCLNAKCFQKKKKEASKKVKAEDAKEAEKLSKKGIVDLSKMGHNSYKPMKKGNYWNAPEFDLKPCNGCKDRKTGKDNWDKKQTVCVNPSCWNEKQEAAERVKQEEAMRQQALLLQSYQRILDDDVGDIEVRLLRYILKDEFQSHRDCDLASIRPWVKKKPKKGWEKGLEKIPDEDMPKAVLMLYVGRIADRMKYDEDAIKNSGLEKLFPELLEGEVELCHRLDVPGPCIKETCASWDADKGCTDDVKEELDAIEEDLGECAPREEDECDPGAFPECNECKTYAG